VAFNFEKPLDGSWWAKKFMSSPDYNLHYVSHINMFNRYCSVNVNL